MGKRLSKIYTRTGDEGMTGLGDGTRVSKTSPRVEAMGQVDELNSLIGLMMSENLPEEIRQFLAIVQHTLFDLGGELSLPGHSLVPPERVTAVENMLDDLNASLAPLEEFILPGGTRAAALCHVARSTCRRVERALFSVDDGHAVSDASRQYINRLSDLLFVMARSLNQSAGEPDILWQHEKPA
ncbi:MAG TPA: cob(I)yrinic acid a,c-diamide adenosyltransferase [Gammaproteobacteria bacterium]|jgi:cob(I)alamin adenosyltransferase|nr:ATP:cob(I)alamin adenosyltransferase [Acidiferrobacteraceae bacterium]MDP6399251.1 cob(I)yrinic acid a,c-diamide adenosyltransferase [Arenicellales bacterium]HCX86784.1 cob(I)yrinic acid a,c-diamide adenosyltransferase [Gammaproteobacteria bacterium]MDP6551086.1 cob(I)yrinic acid a,c-diamide adenosyltransferase [Arenicellales bacterium]MDP6790880.1 cob(I)yrinic acid a,c-diamide adenosyltransferase [Arenicellales bacterium]|tara:strand:+ start:28005 stop:28556 length:552 start_codon:yes stop_codon:yes gene_type:complete